MGGWLNSVRFASQSYRYKLVAAEVEWVQTLSEAVLKRRRLKRFHGPLNFLGIILGHAVLSVMEQKGFLSWVTTNVHRRH